VLAGSSAYAVSQNAIAPVDPEAWGIINGKLYLNNSLVERECWLEKPQVYIKQGDANWETLSR